MVEIKAGYKKTDIGIIPEDWDVFSIKNIAPLQRGFDLPKSQIKSGDVPVAYSNGVKAYHNKSMAQGPGVYTGRSGTIGKVNYIESDYWPHNTSLWVTNFFGNYPKYIYYLYNHIDFKRFSAGSGVPTLNRNDVHSYKCAIPKLEEQKAIADTLQTWDTAIEKTEELIAAKEKQFGWILKRLFDNDFNSYKDSLCDYSDIMKQKKITSVDGLKPLTVKLHCKGIQPNDRDVQIILSKRGRPYFQRFTGEFLIGRQNFHNGGFGIVPKELNGFIASNAITTLDINSSKLDGQYLFYFFSRKDYYLRIGDIMDGTGQKELSDKQIMKLPVSIPSLKKQKEVVQILNTAQREINILKQLADQYHAQKRGLMQKLLTGKWRVKV